MLVPAPPTLLLYMKLKPPLGRILLIGGRVASHASAIVHAAAVDDEHDLLRVEAVDITRVLRSRAHGLQGEVLLGSEEVVLGSEYARGLDLKASCEAPRVLLRRDPGKQLHATVRLGTLLAHAALIRLGVGVGVGAVVLDGRAEGRGLPGFMDPIVRHCGTTVDAESSRLRSCRRLWIFRHSSRGRA